MALLQSLSPCCACVFKLQAESSNPHNKHAVLMACIITARIACISTNQHTLIAATPNLHICIFAAQALGKSATHKTSVGRGAVTGSKAAAKGRGGAAKGRKLSTIAQEVKHVASFVFCAHRFLVQITAAIAKFPIKQMYGSCAANKSIRKSILHSL